MALLLDVANPFFRVCIIEDTVFLRKVAEKLISNKFANGGYGNILQLEVDSVTSYTELLTVHAKRIQEGYYQVVLVDNDLSL